MKKIALLSILTILLISLVACKKHGSATNQALAQDLTHKFNKNGHIVKVSLGSFNGAFDDREPSKNDKKHELIIVTVTNKSVIKKMAAAKKADRNGTATPAQKEYLLKFQRVVTKAANHLSNPNDAIELTTQGPKAVVYTIVNQKKELTAPMVNPDH